MLIGSFYIGLVSPRCVIVESSSQIEGRSFWVEGFSVSVELIALRVGRTEVHISSREEIIADMTRYSIGSGE